MCKTLVLQAANMKSMFMRGIFFYLFCFINIQNINVVIIYTEIGNLFLSYSQSSWSINLFACKKNYFLTYFQNDFEKITFWLSLIKSRQQVKKLKKKLKIFKCFAWSQESIIVSV